jgi:hypothetical protein
MPTRFAEIKPPRESSGLLTDIWFYFIRNPKPGTLFRLKTKEDRLNYNDRILQRLGIKSDDYTILNIHRIGVNAPPSYVFNELLKWSGDSTCWPNHIARVDLIDDRLEEVRILPFRWLKYPLNFKSLFGFKVIPLFLLNAIRFKTVPDSFDFDNARYLLYRCSGGYPIGIFAMYVRSSIPEMDELEPAQLFFMVGFNFYGHKEWAKKKLLNRLWEAVHNRVTRNVLHRFKLLCEWRLQTIYHEADLLNHFDAGQQEANMEGSKTE